MDPRACTRARFVCCQIGYRVAAAKGLLERISSSSDFTIAFSWASFLAPDESIVCTKVGRPVGIAEIEVYGKK